MARTTFSTNDASTVKLWAKALAVEVLKATKIAPLIGTSSRAIVQMKRETNKNAGDRVRFALRAQLSGDGVTENEVLEGNEESLTFYTDDLTINELHHAVKIPNGSNSIDAQRVLYDLRMNARDALADWFTKRLSITFFNQVCGYTPETNTKNTGLNPVTAPTRQIWAGTATADESLTSSNVFDLRLIDNAVEEAKTGTYPIRPVMVDGEEMFVMYLHPYQVTDMRSNTSNGQWLDIQKAVAAGGRYGESSNPIFTGALGVYNGVVLREAYDITQGVNSSTGAAVSNVRRAVLLGAQAAVYGIGQGGRKADFDWVEETFDYKRWLGVSAQTIMGMKKTVFNGEDYGVCVVSTYAAKHT